MIYPSFAYSADSFTGGHLPLWDPYSDCGYPFHAEPGTPAWNPLTALLGMLFSDTGTGFIWYWLIHWWWGGAGMLLWARKRGAGTPGALIAAVAYAFSGFFIGHAEHTSFIVLAGWLPWIFHLSEEAVETGRTDRALLAGAAFGYACLSGYPGFMPFTGLALGLWLLSRHLADNPSGTAGGMGVRALPVLKTLALAGIVAVVVWSPSLHAFFVEGGGYTERVAALAPEIANQLGPFPPSAFFSLFFPFAGILGRDAIPTDISMSNGYVGIFVIPLALTWFLRKEGSRRPWGFAAFLFFMLLVSIGGRAGLRTLLYYAFPPLRFMRFSAPFRLFWIMPLCLAGGQGFGILVTQAKERLLALKILAGWGCVAVVSALVLDRFLGSAGVETASMAGTLYAPAFILFVFFAAVLLIWSREAPGKPGSPLVPMLLAALVFCDMAAHLRNNSPTVWAPSDTIRQAEAVHRRDTLIPGDPGPRLPPLPYGFFNVHLLLKAPVSRSYVTMLSKGFDEGIAGKGSRFVEVLQAAPRFWLSPGVSPLPSRDEAIETLRRTGAGDNVPLFVDGAAAAGLGRGSVVPGTFGAVRTVLYSPERVDLSVDVPGKAVAFLASTERITAGWRVLVDGVRQDPVRTNLYFRGVPLPPGRHSVVWEYKPSRLFPMLAFSFLTLLLCASAPALRKIGGRFRSREASGR